MLKSHHIKGAVEAGCDEVGRGCLAGPVVAAAVILPPNYVLEGLTDSKKLSEKKRLALEIIIKKDALAYAIAYVDHTKIDEINILNASFLAMTDAVKQLNVTPEHLLIDGNKFKSDLSIPYTCMIKGDSRYASIAAASILAKNSRDQFMQEQHILHPHYDWKNNKGYPTKKHRAGIEFNGTTEIHRKSFQLLAKQLTLNL